MHNPCYLRCVRGCWRGHSDLNEQALSRLFRQTMEYQMKTLLLAAIAALSLGAVAAQAAPNGYGSSHSGYHQGPYDNTGQSPGETGLEGGGG